MEQLILYLSILLPELKVVVSTVVPCFHETQWEGTLVVSMHQMWSNFARPDSVCLGPGHSCLGLTVQLRITWHSTGTPNGYIIPKGTAVFLLKFKNTSNMGGPQSMPETLGMCPCCPALNPLFSKEWKTCVLFLEHSHKDLLPLTYGIKMHRKGVCIWHDCSERRHL